MAQLAFQDPSGYPLGTMFNSSEKRLARALLILARYDH
jgi:hypothetical protein